MTSHSDMRHLLTLVRAVAVTAEFPVVVHLIDMAIMEVEELAAEADNAAAGEVAVRTKPHTG